MRKLIILAIAAAGLLTGCATAPSAPVLAKAPPAGQFTPIVGDGSINNPHRFAY